MQSVLSEWWATLPSFSRLVLFLVPAVYVPTLFFYVFMISTFANDPEQVVAHLKVWKLITAPFVCFGVVHVLFSVVSFVPVAASNEKRVGTTKYAVFFLFNALLVELLYAVCMFLLAKTGLGLLAADVSAGLWPVIMVEMVIRCNRDPDEGLPLLFCPCTIRAKYYPWAFVLLFSFFGVFFSLVFGLFVGYLRTL